MRFKLWFENQIPAPMPHFNSKEELLAWARKLNTETIKPIEQWAEEVNKQEYGRLLHTSNPVLLYHGSPQEAIAKHGFQITKGTRSSPIFGGYNYGVENHGIFMTDSKPMAHFFGSNRAENPMNYTVYSAYANLDNLFDMTGPTPPAFTKLGLKLINDYEGTKKRKLAQADMWWLLDQSQFVGAIKAAGYNAVKFKEAPGIRKEAEKSWTIGSDPRTYLIFDPSHLIVKSTKNDVIRDTDTLWDYISVPIYPMTK